MAGNVKDRGTFSMSAAWWLAFKILKCSMRMNIENNEHKHARENTAAI
jgi:hypothetical protein